MLSLRLQVGAAIPFESKVGAYNHGAFIDWLVTICSCINISLNCTSVLRVTSFFLIVEARLNTPVAIILVPRHILCSIAKRVLVYLFHACCVTGFSVIRHCCLANVLSTFSHMIFRSSSSVIPNNSLNCESTTSTSAISSVIAAF